MEKNQDVAAERKKTEITYMIDIHTL